MTKPNLQMEQLQIKKLAELGAYLRQFRCEQAVTLEEVAAKTKIQVRLLSAIEEGNFSHLPESVYVQGFIRKYADALGLNGAELANGFPTEPMLQAIKPSWRNLPAAQLRPIHLYLLYLVLIIGAVSGLSYLVNRPGSQLAGSQGSFPQPDIQASSYRSTLSAPTADRAASTSGSSDLDAQSVEAGKSVRVGVKLTAQSWIRVVADGKTAYEGILDEGTQRTWSADKQLTLRAGNAGGVMVALNNGQAKQLGQPGTVEEVTFNTNSRSATVPRSMLNTITNSLPPSASTF